MDAEQLRPEQRGTGTGIAAGFAWINECRGGTEADPGFAWAAHQQNNCMGCTSAGAVTHSNNTRHALPCCVVCPAGPYRRHQDSLRRLQRCTKSRLLHLPCKSRCAWPKTGPAVCCACWETFRNALQECSRIGSFIRTCTAQHDAMPRHWLHLHIVQTADACLLQVCVCHDHHTIAFCCVFPACCRTWTPVRHGSTVLRASSYMT